MNDLLFLIDDIEHCNSSLKGEAITALESGKVVYFPNYFPAASLERTLLNFYPLFSESILDGKHKNVSFDYTKKRLGGLNKHYQNSLETVLFSFMQDFAEFSYKIIDQIFPQYSKHLQWGRTSYRPAEIEGRVSSKRKDDTRVHVDAFPSTPVQGLRILRVFCNINPNGLPRVWNIGEPFTEVIHRFAKYLPSYNPIKAKLLYWVKATKSLRSVYDHYQLALHDAMKLDDHYQKTVNKAQIDFPAHSTWVVFTDHVSHAALSGQFLLEQTFYIPVEAMQNADFSPLRYWEKVLAGGEEILSLNP